MLMGCMVKEMGFHALLLTYFLLMSHWKIHSILVTSWGVQEGAV